MTKTINETVEVVAKFAGDIDNIKPSQFRWHDREFKVEKSSRYRYRNGDEVIYVFSVSDGLSSFELDFNLRDFSWMLRKVYDMKLV